MGGGVSTDDTERTRDELKTIEDRYCNSSMDILKSLRSEATCRVELNTQFTAVCPTDGHRDEYTLKIQYQPNGCVIELESLTDFLKQFEDEAVSQESLCTFIHRIIWTHFGFDDLTVTVIGDHYGIEAVTEVNRTQ